MPFDWTTMVIVHAIVATATLAVATSVLLMARRAGTATVASRAGVFIALFLAQGLVGMLRSVGVAPEPSWSCTCSALRCADLGGRPTRAVRDRTWPRQAPCGIADVTRGGESSVIVAAPVEAPSR